MSSGSGRWIPAVVAVVVLLVMAGGAWALRSFDPERATVLPACRFNQLTGLQCPGCGMTRATHHLLNGRVARAFYYNSLYVATLPAMGLWGAWWLRQWWSDRPISRRALRINAWLGGCLLAVWLVFWFVRNLPGWPLL